MSNLSESKLFGSGIARFPDTFESGLKSFAGLTFVVGGAERKLPGSHRYRRLDPIRLSKGTTLSIPCVGRTSPARIIGIVEIARNFPNMLAGASPSGETSESPKRVGSAGAPDAGRQLRRAPYQRDEREETL